MKGTPLNDSSQLLTLTLGPVAHGGHTVARHDSRVVFVRHGLPGEVVTVRLTESEPSARFWRADVVDVLEASPDRREHPWPEADALRAARRGAAPVGGAEFGHATLQAQRQLKSAVLGEQLRRLAGLDRETEVEGVDDDGLGLHWRTRMAFAVTQDGRLGMHAHRSEEVIPVRSMPLATGAIEDLALWDLRWDGIARLEVAAPANGSEPLVVLWPREGLPAKERGKALSRAVAQLPEGVSVSSMDPETSQLLRWRGRSWVKESVAGFEYRVTGEGFWQIHRKAPETLMSAAMGFLQDGGFLREGASVADLYAGAGLFTAPLASAVGPAGAVLSVEGSPGTSRDARKNLHGQRQVEIVQGKVERVLRARPRRLDALILDPPRAGAGKTVVQQLVRSGPGGIAYVSCDPASFARDIGFFQDLGWEMRQLRAFDLYPNTHHLETVTLLTPSA
ncbi:MULTISPECIES: TRAM domain-containing protein [Arthrobacter]|uniref:TRAM domain-containing protein n=2 Tax=Arthrobacter TaxID=1663 RepID=A0ABU9KG50_9MICC|nr:TRAM domain-containing protein [Arthrobacter sp. YJM1]MDP5225863.1 TRAM domain-containing protein [Arthrobacter sp. YJM1]